MTQDDWISRASAEYIRHGADNPVKMARSLFDDHDDGSDWNPSANYDPEGCVRDDIAERGARPKPKVEAI